MAAQCPKCRFENTSDSKFCKECGTQLLPVGEPSVTKTIETPVEEYPRGSTFADRYKIIEKLGLGGMGAVYRVEDTNIGQDIALKLIKPDIASDKKTIERFRIELKTAGMISHRNVCRMFDLAETEGTFYITMEFVPGEDLKSFIRRVGQLPSGKAISIAKQVCEGLAEAHRLGVVHRDLKSSNIMIDKDGNARIMDFGIARSLRAKGLTGEGIIIGTPEYMSPEQAEAKDVDKRSDIYSLGVILYEMVTGELPFVGNTPLSIAMKHKGETPKDPKELNPQLPEGLSRVILNCLEKEKDLRYQSTGDLLTELDRLKQELPTTDTAVPTRKPLTPREITVQLSLKKLFIPSVIVFIVIAVVLILWRPWKQKKQVLVLSDKPSLAVMYFDNNTGDEDLDHWRKSLADLLTNDLFQSKYLHVLDGKDIYGILEDLDLLEATTYSAGDMKKVADAAGISHLLVGDYNRYGQTFIFNVQIKDMYSGKTLESLREEAQSEEEIPNRVDNLTRRIKEILGFSAETIAQDFDTEIGKAATSNPDALRYYTQGRSFHLIGDRRNAAIWYKKALEIDPEFVMAYRALGVTEPSLEKRLESLQKAFDLRDRVSERERLQIEQTYYYNLNKNAQAVEAGEKLLEIYPDDVITRNNLQIYYYSLGDLEKSLEQTIWLIPKVLNNVLAASQAVSTYRALNQYENAIQVVEDYLKNVGEHAWCHSDLSRIYIDLGKYEQALEEVEIEIAMTQGDSGKDSKADILILKGDWEEAEKLLSEYRDWWRLKNLRLIQGRYREAVEIYESRIQSAKDSQNLGTEANWHQQLASILLRAGMIQKARDEANRALALARQVALFQAGVLRDSLFTLGLIQSRMKKWQDVKKTASELRSLVDNDKQRYSVYVNDFLAGAVAYERQNYKEALGYCNKALSLQWNAPGTYRADLVEYLAKTYERMGETDKARKEYEKISNLTTGRQAYGDIYVKSFYNLGRIYEQQGNTAKAIENFEKFLSLWKVADPGIVEVEDARKRLAGLRAQ